jgi:hypothetical protein
MNAALTPMQPTFRMAESSLDALAVSHYEQVYGMCHAFYDDPSICLGLANQAFRDTTATPNLIAVVGNLAHLLSRRSGVELPVPAHTLLSNLAWLLKDVMSLSYTDIGEALGMDTEQVKHEIAAVRETLLSMVPEQAAA